MKKQIALLATIIAASGFTAFGQGYVQFQTATKDVWDEFTTSGSGIIPVTPDIDVALLWAATGTSDQLSAVAGASSQYGLRGQAAASQVATNGVTSVGSANPFSTITTMLGAGWNWATNVSTGTAGVGTIAVAAETAAGAITYTGGLSGSPQFQIGGTTAGSTYELIAVAWNASASSFSAATDVGWSNPINYVTGATSSDVNGLTQLQSELSGGNPAGENQFGVAAVPEPTTLALAGLGGLSMLFLRRRKS